MRGGGPITSRNAASGVVEIPDDDPDDITQMYTPYHAWLIAGRNFILQRLKMSTNLK